MSDETVLIPGGRDVRATLDRSGGGAGAGGVDGDDSGGAVVVECPPHPQHRGTRSDERLVAVADALGDRGVDALRFDYGAWDRGYGEREDARNAVRWATTRYDRVALFGYSFGGAVSILAAAGTDDVDAVSALAPASRLAVDLDAADALGDVDVPVQVVYGTRDDTADWEPVVERARERGDEVVEMSADHHFVGQAGKVADAVASFLSPILLGGDVP
ncbi:MAG: alpha/beta hydrolase [Haloferacaceae archaeon]